MKCLSSLIYILGLVWVKNKGSEREEKIIIINRLDNQVSCDLSLMADCERSTQEDNKTE